MNPHLLCYSNSSFVSLIIQRLFTSPSEISIDVPHIQGDQCVQMYTYKMKQYNLYCLYYCTKTHGNKCLLKKNKKKMGYLMWGNALIGNQTPWTGQPVAVWMVTRASVAWFRWQTLNFCKIFILSLSHGPTWPLQGTHDQFLLSCTVYKTPAILCAYKKQSCMTTPASAETISTDYLKLSVYSFINSTSGTDSGNSWDDQILHLKC